MNKFEPGATVYDIHGRAGAYIARAAHGHIVEPMFEDDEDREPRYGEAQTWREVFLKPPVEKLHAEVAEVEAKLTAARAALAEVQEQRRQFDAQERERLARLKRHDALRYVDDLLAGRLPPLCVQFHDYYSPAIVATSDALKNKDADRSYREPALKMLTLFGSSNGDLQWGVNQYHDGSGRNTELFFVATEAEGVAEIRRRYARAVAEWRERPADRKHYGDAIAWATNMPAGWIEVPEDVAAYIAAAKREAARQAHEKALKALAEAEQRMREVAA